MKAATDWRDGYLTVTVGDGWRDVVALCSPVRGWEAQTFDGVWRPTAAYSGCETPPHRDDLPEDRTFTGLVATNGVYDAGAEILAYVECATVRLADRMNDVRAADYRALAAKAGRIGAELAKDALPPVGTPYVRGWELVALNRAGFHAAFFDGLEKTFGAMLDSGATTYWEGFDAAETGNARYAFYGWSWGKSLCHAWSA